MKKFVKKINKIDNDLKKIEVKTREDRVAEEKKTLKPIIHLKSDINVNNIKVKCSSKTEPKLRKVTGIDITFMSSEEIENMAFVQLTHSKLSGDNSIYDPRMGPIKNYENCVVCGLIWSQCPGHPSFIKLNTVIPHPIMMRRISDFLTCFCGNNQCNRLIMKRSEIRVLDIFKYKGENRFSAFLEQAKKIIKCSHCQSPHGKYTIKDDKFIKLFKIRSTINKIIISYEEVAEIIKNIRQQDLNIIGIVNPLCHPEHMLIKNMLGLPSSSRPFVESNNNVCHDDLSYKYIEIIKVNSRLSQKLDEKQYYDAVDTLMFHVKTFIDNSKNKARDPGGKRSLKALKQRLTGKAGLIRQNIQGKRTGLCIRSVISPDPDLHVDEVGIPQEVAERTAYPLRVGKFNMEKCYELLGNDRVLNIKRGNFYIDAKRATNFKGYVLKHNDALIRDKQILYPITVICNGKHLKTITKINDRYEEFKVKEGDSVITNEYKVQDGVSTRKKIIINNIKPGSKKQFRLMEGDIIERKLQDGDWVMFNRQPTLHEASMRAKKVKIHKDRTLKMELSSTQGYNADFDGDEMNAFIAASECVKAEMQEITSTSQQFIAGSDSKPVLAMKQDAMVGGYILTKGRVKIRKADFMDACLVTNWDTEVIVKKIEHIKKVYIWTGMFKQEVDAVRSRIKLTGIYKNDINKFEDPYMYDNLMDAIRNLKADFLIHKDIKRYIREKQGVIDNIYETIAMNNLIYTGHSIISMIIPRDFEYNCDNKIDKLPVKITRGVIVSGTLNKVAIGSNSGSLIHHLYKDYGCSVGADFITFYQRIINLLLCRRGFSVGIGDCLPKSDDLIEHELEKSFIRIKEVLETEKDPEQKESKIINMLNDATNVGEKLVKQSLTPDNNLCSMVISGSKGSMFNIVHITSAVGQQNLECKRIAKTFGGRTLPCYQKCGIKPHDPDFIHENNVLTDYEKISRVVQSRGMIVNSFFKGLSPQEFFFLSSGGRDGLIDSAVKTALCGYISRRILKLAEDIKISYAQTMINSRGNVIEFVYGDNNISPYEIIKTNQGMQYADIDHIVDKLNANYEWETQQLI